MPAYLASGSLILRFGEGDIAICTARAADSPYANEIAFAENHEPRPIGSANPEHIGRSTADLACPVRLVFDRVESVDVLIGQLQALRAGMCSA